MDQFIVNLQAVVSIINGILFVLPFISKRVRRFLIRLALTDIVLSLYESKNGDLVKWVETLCLFFETSRKKGSGTHGGTSVTIEEKED